MESLTRMFNTLKPFQWSDAFYKFGFDDGEGVIRTYDVAEFLRKHSYEVSIYDTGLHNKVINSIKVKEYGKELLPLKNPRIHFGYDNPRHYLPLEIINSLDKKFKQNR